MFDARIYKLFDQSTEIHMIGEFVCVRWNCRHENCQCFGPSGESIRSSVMIHDGEPYIDAVILLEDKNSFDGFYIKDDSPIAHGMSEKFARQIARELIVAADYLVSLS